MITVKKRIAVLIAFNMLFGIAACAGPENSSESHAEDSTHVSGLTGSALSTAVLRVNI